MTGLRHLFGRLRPAAPDADLVRAFADSRDEAAFEQLVRRHGPLVFGVCRRVYLPAAEDAFQATFLLLALKAGRLRDPAGVAGWLHGVAVRTSREAKAMAARRRLKERLAARPEAAPNPPDAETLARLDTAVQELPARYRAVVLLCDLAEKTRAEAAVELGVPEGTVASRLARGRKLLAAKLAGTVPAVVGVTVPPLLKANTVQAGVLLAAGGAVPPAVSVLVTGVTRAMSGSVLKPVLAAGLVAVGGVWVASAGDGPKPADPPPQPVAAKPKAETPAERWKKLKEEYDAEYRGSKHVPTDPKTGKPYDIPNYFAYKQPPVEKYAERLMALGRCEDEATAVAALSLAVCGWLEKPLADDAFDLLLERFAASTRLADFARTHHAISYPAKFRRCQRLLGVATDPTARAINLLDLGIEMEPGRAPRQMGEADDAWKVRAAAAYRRLIADYPDIDGGDCGNGCRLPNLAGMARKYLSELGPIPGEK